MTEQTPSRTIDHLAQQDGAPIAELGHEVAELMPRIGGRDRVGPLRHALAGEDFDPLWGGKRVGVEAELARQGPVDLDEARHGRGARPDPDVERTRQARVAVVEREMNGHEHLSPIGRQPGR